MPTSNSHTYHPNLEDDAALQLVRCILRLREIIYEVVDGMQDEPDAPRFGSARELSPNIIKYTTNGLRLLVSGLPAWIVSPWGNISLSSSYWALPEQTARVMEELQRRGVVLEYLSGEPGGEQWYAVLSVDGIELPRAELGESAFSPLHASSAAFSSALEAVRAS